VAVDHRQIVQDAWVNATASDCYGADDVMAHTLPMAFNAGLLVTLAGPLVGTTTAMYDVRGRGIAGLPGFVETVGATVAHMSPAILRALVAADPPPRRLASLRSLTIAGEAAHGRDVAAARALLPAGCTVFNRYGSAETSLITEFRLGPGAPTPGGPLSVGRPVGHTRVAVTDDAGNRLPTGEIGVVEVTRDVLAMGYWRDGDLTAAAYRDNPDGTRTYRGSDLGRLDADGMLHLHGRRDHSVKVRGQLVEPAEVDAALFSLPEVAEAVVVGRPRSVEDDATRLVAYLVPAVERLSPAGVRASLRERLPVYMVPESIVLLDRLPRTERGKIDRSALPEPPAALRGSHGQELSTWERLVTDVWARVLGLPDVGLDDDFFALGGDSLAVEALLTAMTCELGVAPNVATSSALVQAPTAREFAARIVRRPVGDDVLVPLRTKGTRRPLFVVAGSGGLGVGFAPLVRHLDDDQPVYALQAHAMEVRGKPDWTVRGIARRNIEALRRVQPNGPHLLAGHSFGGIVALEMAHQLRRAGEEVGMLVVLDAFPPDPRLHLDRPPMPLSQRVKEAVGVALTGLRGRPGADQYWRFYRLGEWQHRWYRCAPYPGRTVVVLADSPEFEARSQWAPHLVGPWSVVRVGGDHHSMIREPFVAETAAAVETALAEWRSTLGPGAVRDPSHGPFG
jgi:thioesterase domain-containing protein